MSTVSVQSQKIKVWRIFVVSIQTNQRRNGGSVCVSIQTGWGLDTSGRCINTSDQEVNVEVSEDEGESEYSLYQYKRAS